MANAPTTLLAEITHRCPLHCPYCSNPLAMVGGDEELPTADWLRVFAEARDLGVLQLGLSGGEPLARKDVEELAEAAHKQGLYTTLVTSGIGLTEARAKKLRDVGLEHVQISIQDSDLEMADRIAGMSAAARKTEAVALVRELGFALSINAVLHRANIGRTAGIIALAESVGAERLELANTQFYGWAFRNRAALLPTRAQAGRAREIALAAKERLGGKMEVVYVVPDYFADRPKPCVHK